ncbi:MAG: MlaD family protein [Candidatus Cloacimonetes bacterium]|nr:MlaD family protein [Candidatus Cloacimonadota bacterium]
MKYYQDKKKIEFQVGIFSILALIILFFSYSWLGDFFQQKNYQTFFVRFSNIQSLQKGSPVTILGVKKGKVNSFEVSQDGVVLEIFLDKDFILKNGTKFYILETNIMGDTALDIVPGKSDVKLDTSILLESESVFSISSLLQIVSTLATDLQNITSVFAPEYNFFENLNGLIDSSKVMISQVNNTLSINSENVTSLIQNLSEVSSDFKKMIKQNEESVSNSVKLTQESFAMIKNNLIAIESITRDFKKFSTDLVENDNNVNSFLKDKEFYDKLLKTSTDLDSLILDIRKNPKRYFQIKVF